MKQSHAKSSDGANEHKVDLNLPTYYLYHIISRLWYPIFNLRCEIFLQTKSNENSLYDIYQEIVRIPPENHYNLTPEIKLYHYEFNVKLDFNGGRGFQKFILHLN